MWDCLIRAIDHGFGILTADLGQHLVARMTLNERTDLAVVGAKNQIAFPVNGQARSLTQAGRSRIETVSVI